MNGTGKKTRIKICGLFRDCDIDFVNEAKPDYAGFILAPSRRQVSVDQVRAWRRRLDPAILPVGVFVNAPAADIAQLCREGIISLAQLHGQEDEAFILQLKSLGPVPVIKAIRVNSQADILDWQSSAADYLLLDNGGGGTGQAFDWRLIHRPDSQLAKRFFLAGGINGDNIGAALDLAPFAIDISSGAETGGVKDRKKILQLVGRVRRADLVCRADRPAWTGEE